MRRRRSRVGLGILLIFFGVASFAGRGENPPDRGVETVTYYAVTFALFAGGLWLIFRRRKSSADA